MGILNNIDNKCWQGCGEQGTLLHCWWEPKLVQPLWKAMQWSLKKPKIKLPHDSMILLIVMYPKECASG
jgi:hypothetical protein